MGALTIAFDTMIVGALALPWVLTFAAFLGWWSTEVLYGEQVITRMTPSLPRENPAGQSSEAQGTSARQK